MKDYMTVEEIFKEMTVDEIENLVSDDIKRLLGEIDVSDEKEVSSFFKRVEQWLPKDEAKQKIKEAKKYVEHLRRKKRIASEIGGWPETGVEFVELYFLKHNVVINIDGTMGRDNAANPQGDNVVKLLRDIKIERDRLKLNQFSYYALELAMDSVVDRVIAQRHIELRQDIAFSVEAEQAMKPVWDEIGERLIDLDGDKDLAVAALKKFIWQVKRKIHGIPITNHIMLVIYLWEQGVGKSVFVDKLITPVKSFSVDTNFGDIVDIRNLDLWQNYVLQLPEMSKAENASDGISTLRHLITGETISRRPLGTNKYVKVNNNATFIGDSNKSINELIHDTDGMRRFIQLQWKLTHKEKDKLQEGWEFVNTIDSQKLWQSIDETKPDPTTVYYDKIKDIQSSYRALTAVERWLVDEDRDENRADQVRGDEICRCPYNKWTDWKGAAAVYKENFKPWQDANGGKYTSRGFFMELRRLAEMGGYGLEHKKLYNKSMWRLNTDIVKINSDDEMKDMLAKLKDK